MYSIRLTANDICTLPRYVLPRIYLGTISGISDMVEAAGCAIYLLAEL